jgi:hypothetical protein
MCKDLRYSQDNDCTVSDFVRSIEDSYLRRQVGREKPATVSKAATALRDYVEYGQTPSRNSMSAASVATAATAASTGAPAATATGASTGATTGATTGTAAATATGAASAVSSDIATQLAQLTNQVEQLVLRTQPVAEDYNRSSSGSYAEGQQWRGNYSPHHGGRPDAPPSYGRPGQCPPLKIARPEISSLPELLPSDPDYYSDKQVRPVKHPSGRLPARYETMMTSPPGQSRGHCEAA